MLLDAVRASDQDGGRCKVVLGYAWRRERAAPERWKLTAAASADCPLDDERTPLNPPNHARAGRSRAPWLRKSFGLCSGTARSCRGCSVAGLDDKEQMRPRVAQLLQTCKGVCSRLSNLGRWSKVDVQGGRRQVLFDFRESSSPSGVVRFDPGTEAKACCVVCQDQAIW